MKIDLLGKLYIALMSGYFIISGANALLDIDAKLARIGLAAINFDGKIAFILIYCSLMVGIGIAIALLYYYSKSWQYSALLATTIVTAFIVFRILGAFLVGTMSQVQLTFSLVEFIEVTIGLILLKYSTSPVPKLAN